MTDTFDFIVVGAGSGGCAVAGRLSEDHGKGGPLHVNRLRSENPIHDIFHQAAREAQFRIRETHHQPSEQKIQTILAI